MDELKKCPFCGSDAEVFVRYKDFEPKRNGVRCLNEACGAEIESAHQAEAVARWNRRYADTGDS